MPDRQRLAALLVCLAVLVGLLAWGVVGSRDGRCVVVHLGSQDPPGAQHLTCEHLIQQDEQFQNHGGP